MAEVTVRVAGTWRCVRCAARFALPRPFGEAQGPDRPMTAEVLAAGFGICSHFRTEEFPAGQPHFFYLVLDRTSIR